MYTNKIQMEDNNQNEEDSIVELTLGHGLGQLSGYMVMPVAKDFEEEVRLMELSRNRCDDL